MLEYRYSWIFVFLLFACVTGIWLENKGVSPLMGQAPLIVGISAATIFRFAQKRWFKRYKGFGNFLWDEITQPLEKAWVRFAVGVAVLVGAVLSIAISPAFLAVGMLVVLPFLMSEGDL